MIHGFAEPSGGRLRLRSAPGEGTSAEIWLPVAGAGLPLGEVAARPPEPPVLPAMTIQMVDDDPLVPMNGTALLEDLGHAVVEAASGAQALQVLREAAIDLMIADRAMPGMTGARLIEAVRAERPGLPVVLASGFADLPEGRLAGIVRLASLFGQDDLARALAASLDLAARLVANPGGA
ncbi:hypothetical protein SQ03_10480 [Methylobacterium platani JCM 14648]|nr:hypothetical protein SQ03_10480 [Methylobacterium platani JCM 14648]